MASLAKFLPPPLKVKTQIQVHVNLSPAQKDKLDALTEEHHTKNAALIRALIEHEYANTFKD